ncbi:MAG: prepilin-type N-terminal cleavage/methylation domain-containing protein [Proteobacteria bacterium]|nr:MAG: prepilin-type N-terminal cleavage/methylation domain-containing protein [Pseudomonadota bacterium]
MLKSQSGFSLIELMIVVAIIGILASIAVPNFKKFQVKARQSEAKAQLTSLFTAEKAFYGEWNGYRGDFRDVGYAPEGSMRYQVGFANSTYTPSAPFTPSAVTLAAGGAFNTQVTMGQTALGFTHKQVTGIPTWAAVAANGADCQASTPPTQTTFVASANSNEAALGSDRPDHWSVNQLKYICNNQAGI